LALKYKFGINVAGKTLGYTADNQPIDLSEHIKFGVVDNVTTPYTANDAGRTAARDAVKDRAVLVSAGYASEEAHLSKNAESEPIALVVYMPEEVGNEANHGTGKTAPSIDLGINLVATQYTEESDSFDHKYDENAEYPVITNTSWYNDEETSFELSSAGELVGLSKLVNEGTSFENKTIKLTEDVDLSGIENWIPIGSGENVFTGTFDGGNKTVSNLTISNYTSTDGQAYVGLFGMAVRAEISNLTVTGTIDITKSLTDDTVVVGGVCSTILFGKISNCTNEVTINVKRDANDNSEYVMGCVGGIFGMTTDSAGSGSTLSLSNCKNNANITVDLGEGDIYVGGIAGTASSNHVDSTCTNSGTIKLNGNIITKIIGSEENS